MSGASPRERLLQAVIDVALADGVSDKSLRAIAAAAGTSHRMLIHHFTSREALLVEVIREVERRQRNLLAELRGAPDPETSGPDASAPPEPAEAAWRFWHRLRAPELAAQERLFFEIYGQALQGRAWAAPLLEGIVADWIPPIADLLAAHGIEPAQAPAQARLAIAVTRGLLLDLLATGEAAEVDAAMRLFVRLTMPARPQPG
jgi:AcrR family transcriptional regulator